VERKLVSAPILLMTVFAMLEARAGVSIRAMDAASGRATDLTHDRSLVLAHAGLYQIPHPIVHLPSLSS
jgi:hypothetical protein